MEPLLYIHMLGSSKWLRWHWWVAIVNSHLDLVLLIIFQNTDYPGHELWLGGVFELGHCWLLWDYTNLRPMTLELQRRLRKYGLLSGIDIEKSGHGFLLVQIYEFRRVIRVTSSRGVVTTPVKPKPRVNKSNRAPKLDICDVYTSANISINCSPT